MYVMSDIEDFETRFEVIQKIIERAWIMVLPLILLQIFIILDISFGILERNLPSTITEIGSSIGFIFGNLYFSKFIGKLYYERDYHKKKMEEKKLEQSHPENWIRKK